MQSEWDAGIQKTRGSQIAAPTFAVALLGGKRGALNTFIELFLFVSAPGFGLQVNC